MQVFQENLMLKEKIREYEVDDLNGSEFNLREKIEHNLLFLTEVAKKMEDSIREKKSLDNKLERMAYLVGITPTDLSKESGDPTQLNELNKKIELLNYEVLGLKTDKEELEATINNLKSELRAKSAQAEGLYTEKEVSRIHPSKSSLTMRKG
jgi:chaperonin cofactor prefoldin